MKRHEFLRALHEQVRPRTYVETGIDKGVSMTLSSVPSIGIDPDFTIRSEIITDVHLARTTSDEFFARTLPLAHLPVPVIDLAFIDGMHLAEYALRDYLAVERFTTPASVIVFDDMLPRSVIEAARHRETGEWTGDVYKAAQVLREQRPDLIVLEVDTTPTGVVVVLCPDASRGGVLPGYDEWLDVALAPDPQDVPAEILDRSRAWNAGELLANPGWAALPLLRRKRKVSAAMVRSAFGEAVTREPARA